MPPPIPQTNPDIKAKDAQTWRTSEKIWMPSWRDKNGDPIVNSANLIPIMPLYEQWSIAIYHFIKFKDYTDLEFHDEIDSLNSETWREFTANQAWISEIHTDGPQTLGDSAGENVHYVVRCIKREDGWLVTYPDAGYAYDDTGIQSFVTAQGVPYIGNLEGGGGDGGSTPLVKTAETKANQLDFNAIVGLE